MPKQTFKEKLFDVAESLRVAAKRVEELEKQFEEVNKRYSYLKSQTIDFYPSAEGGEQKGITLMITGYGDILFDDEIDAVIDEAIKENT